MNFHDWIIANYQWWRQPTPRTKIGDNAPLICTCNQEKKRRNLNFVASCYSLSFWRPLGYSWHFSNRSRRYYYCTIQFFQVVPPIRLHDVCLQIFFQLKHVYVERIKTMHLKKDNHTLHEIYQLMPTFNRESDRESINQPTSFITLYRYKYYLLLTQFRQTVEENHRTG